MTPDRFGRPLTSLRVSVTDRCNLRCSYCMPDEDYVWLPRESILSFEELARLVGVFAGLGVQKIRLTGGEPLLRQDLATLVEMLHRESRITDLSLTTNGVLLASHAGALKDAGLDRLTVSLDTLRPARFAAIARGPRHDDVLAGLSAARRAGLPVKINAVVIRGVNDDELEALLEFGRAEGLEIRFIEYMDVGGATRWSRDQVVSRAEMLTRLSACFGPITPVEERATAPAARFRLADGTTFGVIASVTAPFCATCDRSRLTADGTWLMCLYARHGVDLRESLRGGASDDEIARTIAAVWSGRTDRGAEARLAVPARGALLAREELRADPHQEMHTRGG
ncbi:MAG TPA: GTP 3',8-cyclase MoaA [Gemmatimonadales bacterium]|nr:GTP 3',8-cyclase MoaA [Gemmatimonadales bacterium]